MVWYTVLNIQECLESVYSNSVVYKNDENLKPDWVKDPAMNTEFHIQRKKKDLLVVVGESWTYGESLPGIATGDRQYNLTSQITYCFGPRLALALNADYYQYAVPGNCNFYIVSSLERILKDLVISYKYKRIKLCVQLTEPGRELAIWEKLNDQYSVIYDMNGIKTFDDWLVRYDEIFLDELERLRSKYGIEITVWKNFCSFNNKKEYPNLKLIPETWIQESAKMYGIHLESQKFQSVGWFDDFYSRYNDRIKFDTAMINAELDKIEKSNNFINGNFYHNNHPNWFGHVVWSHKLYNDYTK